MPATLAYYINIIVGLDANTFALRSGEPYFVKALNIVTNAPANATIEGWKAFDGQRNRYWLAENLTSTKFTAVHEVMYNYYRKAFDFLYENENQARQEMIACLTQLNNTRNENSGTTNMLIPFLMQAKNNELIQFFKKANATDKATALELLKQIDVINANKYTSELK